MSSSRQRGQLISGEIKTPSICPLCGKNGLMYVKEDCLLEDGLRLPHLKRLQCRKCREDFFDDQAMSVIRDFREKIKQIA